MEIGSLLPSPGLLIFCNHDLAKALVWVAYWLCHAYRVFDSVL